MYNPQHTQSTIIQAPHCSTYLRASIHMAMMLSAVVKLSVQGTLLSVHVINIQAITTQHRINTAVKGKYTLRGMSVMGVSSSVCCMFFFFLPLLQAIQPYTEASR